MEGGEPRMAALSLLSPNPRSSLSGPLLTWFPGRNDLHVPRKDCPARFPLRLRGMGPIQ